MVEFKPYCRQCFIEKGISVKLIERNGELVCPNNPNHKYKNDVQVA